MMDHFLNPVTYAVWSKDEDIRYNSTSGGAFSEFAEVILLQGGCVVGAKYNQSNLAEHTIIYTKDRINEIRQSKYMSSIMKNVYKEVKNELGVGKLVGFCGSPCQIAGLYSFLGKDYENLITMDFICRGMNSPKAFRSWLDEIERKENKEVNKVWFKYKDGGWKSSPRRTRLDFKDGSYKVYEGKKNLYMNGYLTSNLYIRPCCGSCAFKDVPRQGDITLADFWGIEKELDDDKGISLILINSKKGEKLFEEAKTNFNYYERNFNEIFNENPMLTTSVQISAKAHNFLQDLDNMLFTDALKKYGGYSMETSLWFKAVKKLIYQLYTNIISE